MLIFCSLFGLLLLVGASPLPTGIVFGGGSDVRVRFAAATLRRYLLLLHGEFHPLSADAYTPASLVWVGERAAAPADAPSACAPAPSGFALCRGPAAGSTLYVIGSDGASTLHGVAALLERLGMAFRLGDTIVPARPLSFDAAAPLGLLYKEAPVFALRGLQPFHDFAEGPDLWSLDAWAAVTESVAMMKGNALGMHTYPYAFSGTPPGEFNMTGTNEPSVWVGPRSLVKPDGTVLAAYPTSWANSQRHEWAYWPHPTSDYFGGAAALFPHQCAGHDAQSGDASVCPWPVNASAAVALFDRVGALWKGAFGYAAALGVKTILGTEAPLALPPYEGVNASAPGAAQEYYAGAFQRLAALLGENLTAYWVWTPEKFEWNKVPVTSPEVQAVVADLAAAAAARDEVGAPFELVTCGWVVGPNGNRTYLDAVLPPQWTIGSIVEYFGDDSIDPAYANITRHKKWAIPWMEDDPGLTGLQFWVNRTIQRNQQADAYGVSGLLNIHWRTRTIAPQVAASLAYAWNRSLDAGDFWRGWALSEFGPSAAGAAAAIFIALDSGGLPRPVTWITGPGTMQPGNCNQLAGGNYSFVDAFAALRPAVVGDVASGAADAAALERFDYRLHGFKYFRALATTTCAWADFNAVMKNVSAQPAGPARQAAARGAGFAAWGALVGNASAMQWELLASLSSTAELGTAMNTQGQSLLQHAMGPAQAGALAGAAGEPLPPALAPPAGYDALRVPRLVVLAPRTGLLRGEDLRVTAHVVAALTYAPRAVTLWVAPLSGGAWTPHAMPPVPSDGPPRMVFAAALVGSGLPAEGVLWYVTADCAPNTTAFDGPDALLPAPGVAFFPGENITLVFPVTAPARPHSVVIV